MFPIFVKVFLFLFNCMCTVLVHSTYITSRVWIFWTDWPDDIQSRAETSWKETGGRRAGCQLPWIWCLRIYSHRAASKLSGNFSDADSPLAESLSEWRGRGELLHMYSLIHEKNQWVERMDWHDWLANLAPSWWTKWHFVDGTSSWATERFVGRKSFSFSTEGSVGPETIPRSWYWTLGKIFWGDL